MPGLSLPRVGDVIADRFRVEGVIGQGGMGIVLRARRLDDDALVALKFLSADAVEFPELLERFAREARAMQRLRGEHITRVLERGELDEHRDYLALELLEGEDLSAELTRQQRLPAAQAVGYVLQALLGLAEAHANEIVHRDLKPANLFLARVEGREAPLVKVLDFGISKQADEHLALTRTHDVVGTPFYMAPEQLTNARRVDERADIWSIGVILYELLSGQVPFAGRNMTEIITAVLAQRMKPLDELVQDLPNGLAKVVQQCLISERDERFSDVGALAQALAPYTEEGATLAAEVVRLRGTASVPQRSVRPLHLNDSTPAQPLPLHVDRYGDNTPKNALPLAPADEAFESSAPGAPRWLPWSAVVLLLAVLTYLWLR